MIVSRVVKNDAERAFQLAADAAGWTVRKKGYPDFFCMRDGKIALVEVKPTARCRPSKHQRVVMKALSKLGVPCYLWTPESGFTKW